MGGAERDLTDHITLEYSATSKVGPCAELLTSSEGQTTGAGELQQTNLPRAPREMLKANEQASIASASEDPGGWAFVKSAAESGGERPRFSRYDLCPLPAWQDPSGRRGRENREASIRWGVIEASVWHGH